MDILEIIKIFFISLIEGITEWLPVSSTGHMIIFDEIVKLNFSEEFKSLFMVVIQLGAILAVVFLYFEELNPFSPSKSRYEKSKTWDLWKKVIVGCLPMAILGFLLDDFIDSKLKNAWIVASMLILYGILFIVIERVKKRSSKKPKITETSNISYVDALKIGGFQILSLIPGTSRSGSTIIGGLLSGASREVAAEFSFFMGIPLMFGASFLKIVKYGFNYSTLEIFYLSLAMILTFIISIFVIKTLMEYLKKHNFEVFGWYRIALGVIVLAFFLLK
jgi:undecaprenyl-diphosphatase